MFRVFGQIETKPLKDKHFKEMWLNTDKMHYLLNNVRKKGQGGSKFRGLEDLNLQTYIVVTSEVFSRYAFRSDVAYDWDITFEELALDTIHYKDDRLNEFSKKNARLEFSHFPQEPPKKIRNCMLNTRTTSIKLSTGANM